MCTYNQLKKIQKIFVQPPQGVNGAPYVPKLYASSVKDISKCIEGGWKHEISYTGRLCIYVTSPTGLSV